MWSISASVSSDPGDRRGADAAARLGGERLELLAQVRRRVGQEPGALGPADRERRLRARPRGAGAGRLAGRAAAVPLREAAAGGRAEDPSAHRAMIDSDDQSGPMTPARRSSSAPLPAEVEADVLALAADGLRRAPARRDVRGAAGPLARPTPTRSRCVPVAREVRARRVALVKIEGVRARRTCERRRPSGARAPRRRHGRVGARRHAADGGGAPGRGARRGRGPRRLRAPAAGRRAAAGRPRSSASSSAAPTTWTWATLARARRARARAGRTSPASSSTGRPTSSRPRAWPSGRARCPASASRSSIPTAGRPAGARGGGRRRARHPPRLIVLRYEPAGRAAPAAARARGQGGHVRRRRLLPQAAVGHRAPEGRHGRRRRGARGDGRDRRARAAARPWSA